MCFEDQDINVYVGNRYVNRRVSQGAPFLLDCFVWLLKQPPDSICSGVCVCYTAVSELVNASVLWLGQGCRQALSLPAFIPPGVSIGNAHGGLGRAPK